MKEYSRETIVCTYCGGTGEYWAQVILSGKPDNLTKCNECNGTGLQTKISFIEPYNPDKADIRTMMFDT